MSSHHVRPGPGPAGAGPAALAGLLGDRQPGPRLPAAGDPVHVALIDLDGFKQLLRRADASMYAAKKIPGTAFLHHGAPAQAA